ncbi:MAG: hypothetical protein H7301_08890 [Cryobacterium sp.]|nr:hypothetical protein [Oligoflexia bacterium]
MRSKRFRLILDLKPTQFSIGVSEVAVKLAEMRNLKKKSLKAVMEETLIPVVVSPWGELCVIDHHHFLFACNQLGIEEANVEIVEDLSRSNLSYNRFWKKMQKENYAHLEDQFGEGPRSPIYLPNDVRGMADDPYRSLAWLVRRHGGFEKSALPFSEFKWANFFRSKRLLNAHGRTGMKTAVKLGVRLAHSRAAVGLPGYITKDQRAKKSITRY